MKYVGLIGLMFAVVLAVMMVPTVLTLSAEGSSQGGNIGTFFNTIPPMYLIVGVAGILLALGYGAFRIIHN